MPIYQKVIKEGYDKLILGIVILLVLLGIIMVFSTSAILAYQRCNDPYFFLKRQIIWAIIGFLFLFIFLRIDYNKLQPYCRFLFFSTLILLIIIFIPGIGHSVKGSSRWIKIGMINVQPSELAKFALIFYMADFLDRKQSKINEVKKVFIPFIFIVSIYLFLIYLEPDFGTTFVIGITFIVLLIFGNVRLRYIFGLLLIYFPLVYLALFRVFYRKERLVAFLNPWLHYSGKGYQIIQALLAFGAGGILGKGWGESQIKLFYLPNPHTDFIFSVIGEELGFIGASLVIIMFIIFLVKGMNVSLKAPNLFGTLVAAGIVFIISFQAIVNICVVTKIIPPTGITLPFISYGGSSLVCSLAAVGVLLNISSHRKLR